MYDNINYTVIEDLKDILIPEIYNSKITRETLNKMYN